MTPRRGSEDTRAGKVLAQDVCRAQREIEALEKEGVSCPRPEA